MFVILLPQYEYYSIIYYGGPEVQNTTQKEKTQRQIRKHNTKRENTATLTKTEMLGTLGRQESSLIGQKNWSVL